MVVGHGTQLLAVYTMKSKLLSSATAVEQRRASKSWMYDKDSKSVMNVWYLARSIELF